MNKGEVRAIDPPVKRTPEQEELHQKLITSMRKVGKEAKTR